MKKMLEEDNNKRTSKSSLKMLTQSSLVLDPHDHTKSSSNNTTTNSPASFSSSSSSSRTDKEIKSIIKLLKNKTKSSSSILKKSKTSSSLTATNNSNLMQQSTNSINSIKTSLSNLSALSLPDNTDPINENLSSNKKKKHKRIISLGNKLTIKARVKLNNDDNDLDIDYDSSLVNNNNSDYNNIFHQLFPTMPSDETVLYTYSCAYVKSLATLLQGILFLTPVHLCFYGRRIIIIKISSILSIKKTRHAYILPTAIRISTKDSNRDDDYLFTSFRSRSKTFDILTQLHSKIIRKKNNNNNNNNNKVEEEKVVKLNMIKDENEEEEKEEEDDEQTDYNDEYDDEMSIDSDDSDNSDSENGSDYDDESVNQRTIKNYENFYNPEASSGNKLFYQLDFNNDDKNKVTVSLRHKKSLLEKVRTLISLLIPGFFNISRIDSLLPICFLMCILLLLNAFVLLSKVNEVEYIFQNIAASSSSISTTNNHR